MQHFFVATELTKHRREVECTRTKNLVKLDSPLAPTVSLASVCFLGNLQRLIPTNATTSERVNPAAHEKTTFQKLCMTSHLRVPTGVERETIVFSRKTEHSTHWCARANWCLQAIIQYATHQSHTWLHILSTDSALPRQPFRLVRVCCT